MLSIACVASTGQFEFSLFLGSPFRLKTRFRWYSNQSSQNTSETYAMLKYTSLYHGDGEINFCTPRDRIAISFYDSLRNCSIKTRL